MRTDAQIHDDILAELAFEPRLDAAGIGVAVDMGVVTLSGHVSSYAEKVAAENAAVRVKGVAGLAQDIEVRLTQRTIDDTLLTERVVNLLAWSVADPKEGVKVRCENGWVTLSGEVNWQYQRIDADRAVRHLAGVKGVSNRLNLRTRVQPQNVQDQIRQALRRAADLDAKAIKVEVDGDKVTLSGTVSAWSERTIAERAAWSIPGVHQVHDQLSVS